MMEETGAGDAFMSGSIYGVLNGWNIEEIASFSNAVAALAVQKIGAVPSMPRKEEVDDFIDRKENR